MMTVLWLVQRRRGNAGIVDVGCGRRPPGLLRGHVGRSPLGCRADWHVVRPAGDLLLFDRVLGYARRRPVPNTSRKSGGHDQPTAFFPFLPVRRRWRLRVLCVAPPRVAGIPWIAGRDGISRVCRSDRSRRQYRACRPATRPLQRAESRQDLPRGWWRFRAPELLLRVAPLVVVCCVGGWRASEVGHAPCGCCECSFPAQDVTGIPPTEVQALASRGEDYRQYQRTTTRLFVVSQEKGRERRTQTIVYRKLYVLVSSPLST